MPKFRSILSKYAEILWEHASRLLNKGLSLIAIPLVIQAIFLGLLVQTQVEAGMAQKWAVHTKEVMAQRRGNLSPAPGRLRGGPHSGRFRRSRSRPTVPAGDR